MKNKIIFLTPARYPTEKAYGVTTGNTLEALGRLGVRVEIWNRDYSGTDEYGNKLVQPGKKQMPKQRRLYRVNFFGLGRWAYIFDQLKFAVNCLIALKKERENLVAWTRFPLVGLVNSLSPKIEIIIIELHHQPNFTSRVLLRGIRRLKPVKVALISETAKTEFDCFQLGISSFTLEMSVPDQFIRSVDQPLVNPATICYLGKSKSSGNSNKLEFLLTAFSEMKNNSLARIEFIGIESDEVGLLVKYAESLRIPKSSIKFIKHLPHTNVNGYLDGVSIGIVPYEVNKYNAGRFPIKIIEYAAKGIWIIAAEGFARNLCIPAGLMITYRDHDPADLALKIEELLIELSSNPRRNATAIEFAKSHTYVKRAQAFIAEVEVFNLNKST